LDGATQSIRNAIAPPEAYPKYTQKYTLEGNGPSKPRHGSTKIGKSIEFGLRLFDFV